MPTPAEIRARILSAPDSKTAACPAPEWGIPDLHVRVLSGAERDTWETLLVASREAPPGAPRNLRASLAVLAACTPDGTRIFTEADVADLGKKSSAVLHRIWQAALALNRLDDSSAEAVEKNSGGVPGDSLS